MKLDSNQDNSQPFLLRVWKEVGAEGTIAWCGKLQHIVNGDAHLFRDWPTLLALLEANFLDEERMDEQGATGNETNE